MKRSIAFVLAAVLVLAVLPGVSAAGAGSVSTAALMETIWLQEAGQVEEYNFFVPTFDMYGMTVVSGNVMTLEGIVEEGNSNRLRIGVSIYAGTYDTLTEDAEPVAAAVKWTQNMNLWPDSFTWDTTGVSAGDYTAIYYMEEWRSGTILSAAVCDLYISDQAIPLEGLDLYVMELGEAADKVYMDRAGETSMSIGVLRIPYHTTDRREVRLYGEGFGYCGSTFPEGTGISAPFEPGTYTLSAWIGENDAKEFETTVTVVVEDNIAAYPIVTPLKTSTLCYGVEQGFEITLPAGKTMDDVQLRFAVNGLVELTRVEGNTIWLRSLAKSSFSYELVAAVDGRYTFCRIGCVEHSYHINPVKEPTCTEPGLYRYTCKACGDQYEQELPAAGHYVRSFEPIVPRKATKPGIREGLCYRCGEMVQEETPPVFADTQPDRFYSDALDYCYENGIINGLTADTFGPGETLNRAQLVTMLYRHAGSPAVEEGSTFTDVPEGTFYTAPVAWASANGIVNGYSDGTFRPADAITREQIVTMIYRYVAMLGKDNGARDDLSAFTDLDMLRAYAEEPMRWAVANGVINGLSQTVLGAQESANRAQTATILCRVITGILEAE